MDEDFLVGTWRLVEWTRPTAPETVPKTFVGRLTYTRDRRMSVLIHAGGRERVSAENPLDVHPEEMARLARGAVAYAGRWRVRMGPGGETWVEHQVDASLFPNYLPEEDQAPSWQRRSLRVLGPDEMELTAGRGDGDVTRLRWRRLRA